MDLKMANMSQEKKKAAWTSAIIWYNWFIAFLNDQSFLLKLFIGFQGFLRFSSFFGIFCEIGRSF